MMAKNTYTIPIPREMLQGIDRSSSPAHVGKLRNAVDFIAPKGTSVLAAADGIVDFINDNSNVGGPDASYWFYTNFITIRHSNGEFSRYDHLEYKSSKVGLNQKVHAGDEISKVGMTGFTFIPHLHFQVFIVTGYNIWTDFETIEIKNFRNIL
jgi:murein DD-endopeptidase MepM/ murein hydrolase activator NlpD